ncbi:hypothetical protein ONZ45_g18449 [Pleurotus djamor]|nr:hypothetical protein ONZ45_g18449 [Pleurotus djamor]
MNEERAETLLSNFDRRMLVCASGDPERPSQRAGIAIILNRGLLEADEAPMKEIVPGRAASVEFKIHNNKKIRVLGVYAPNDPNDNARFWKKILDHYEENPGGEPDVILGDFNMVEEAIDRFPAHTDKEATTAALDDLKFYLNMKDGWRNTYPTTRAFTFFQDRKRDDAEAVMSRIDRIYMKNDTLEQARDWLIEPSGLKNTDHYRVSVYVSTADAPELGQGRWTIPPRVLKDKTFKTNAEKIIEKAHETLRALGQRSSIENPQTIFHRCKKDILEGARSRDKLLVPEIKKKIQASQEKLKELSTRDHTPHTAKQLMIESKALSKMERLRHQKARRTVRALDRLEGETISRSWIRNNKKLKPRDIIYALKRLDQAPGETRYETKSRKMSTLARDYHEELQRDQREDRDEVERILTTNEILRKVDKTIPEQARREMSRPYGKQEVLAALKLTSNNKAAGVDGATYELWKLLMSNKEGINEETQDKMLEIYTSAINDISDNGVSEQTKFAEGWMCPIYKKNDKSEISNYRPITLLNTDYKLFTKILTMRLAPGATETLDKSQAGFVPGRQISEQTQLLRLLMDHADATETNGIIVALDQEKAYDKIEHDYLWRVMKRFDFPERFTNTVKSLYENAETSVMINGFLSETYKINRGVRQGDPLSCLLFDFAIEPLSLMIRKSQITGYEIPGTAERIVANLFADDTTVIMNETDELTDLQEILDDWCLASGAKFNVQKTQIIPIGSKAHRQAVIENRKMGDSTIPEHMTIIKDGDLTRILGAWFGNNCDTQSPWTPIIERIDSELERWGKSHPTFQGRKHIIQMEIGGRTQYLAKVQGMNKQTENAIKKRIRSFFWDGKTSQVKEDTIYAPIDEGGFGVLDIVARNEAIQLTWIKEYLNLDNRPLWALLADDIIARAALKKDKNIPRDVKYNMFLQTWRPKTIANDDIFPKHLKSIIKTATKYGLRIETVDITRGLAREMPVWLHARTGARTKRISLSTKNNCLKNNHKLRTVGDAEDVANVLTHNDHTGRNTCKCNQCKDIRRTHGCKHPHTCMKQAEMLLNSLPKKWDPRAIAEAPQEAEPNERDWSRVERIIPAKRTQEIFRVFTEGEEKTDEVFVPDETVRAEQYVATDGSCKDACTEEAKAGAGVFFAPEDPRNRAVKVPNDWVQSNQTGELLAILVAISENMGDFPLRIESDSKYAINVLTNQRTKIENAGGLDRANTEIIQRTLAKVRERKGPIYIKWVKGHNGHEGNEEADRLADRGTDSDEYAKEGVPEPLRLTGIRLDTLTQKLAYKAIRGRSLRKREHEREKTKAMIERVIAEMEDKLGKKPTPARIWRAIRDKDISRGARSMLWTMAHDTRRVGKYWLKDFFSEEQKMRAECAHCQGALESMEHILYHCETPGQEEVWALAKEMWENTGRKWQQPYIGGIIACGLRSTDRKKTDSAGDRLWTILISESAYFISNLRNERVIANQNTPFTETEVRNRWIAAIDRRIEIDVDMTKHELGKKAIPIKKVLQTWEKAVVRDEGTSQDAGRRSGVLVGIGPMHQCNQEGVG